MKYTSETWPIAAKMAFGPNASNGEPIAAHPHEWKRQMQKVHALGFTAFDPTDDWVPFWTWSETEQDEFLRYATELGLTIPSLSMGRRSVVDVEHGVEHLEIAKKFVDFAVKCGASIVNVGFMQALKPAQAQELWFWYADGHKDDPELRPLAVSRVQELADYAAPHGVQISLEMYEDTYCGTADDAVAFVTDVARDNVGLNPDIGNLFRLHRPVEHWKSAYAKVLPYANFWHIKNYIRDEDKATGAYFTTPAPLETGTINYREVIEQAVALGYEGPFMAEHYGGDWLTIGIRNANYIRSILKLELGE